MQSTSTSTTVSDPYYRYHVVAYRNLFFSGPKYNEVVILHRTNRKREAEGLVKQEINSHIDMLKHHEYFNLTFELELLEGGICQVISGYNDYNQLTYQYIVRVIDNA